MQPLSRSWTSSFIVGLSALTFLWPIEAHPCGNPIYIELNASPKLVAKAEAALEQGRNRRAMYLLDRVTSEKDKQLAKRIRMIHAVAAMRWLRNPEASDKYNRPPVKVLRSLLAEDPENPYLRARVAEALTYKKDGVGEALQILGDLETRDLMPDAEGWGTLALLRERTGDKNGRERALARCRAIAKYAAACPFGTAQNERAAAHATASHPTK